MMKEQLPQDVRLFTGGMDKQSEQRFIAQGDYVELRNGYNGGAKEDGAIQEAWGNFEIINSGLYAGENKFLGYTEDLKDDSIIFCVWNSLGYHGIYRYYRNKPPYPNGVIEAVYVVKNPSAYDKYNPNPLSFEKDKLITGCNLIDNNFLWTDGNVRSKCIDIVRGNRVQKRLRFKLIFNKNNLNQTSNYTLTYYRENQIAPVGTIAWSSSAPTISGRVEDFISVYNSQVISEWSIESCSDYVILEVSQPGDYYFDLTENSSTPSIVVAENFYPDKNNALTKSYTDFKVDFIDRLRYVPLLPPKVNYATDTSKEINLVRGKVFQFAVRYTFFDNSQSVFSARSKIAIPSTTDSPNIGTDSNCIDVTFQDPRLESPELVSVIKSVEIGVNQPAIDDTWFTVKVLQQHEIAGLNMATYRFYNDNSLAPIADLVISKDNDSLFITHKSEEIVDNRSFIAGGVDGYNTPCVDYTQEVITTPANVQGHTITGKIRITNPRSNIDQFVFRRLYTDVEPPTNTPFYGGYMWANPPFYFFRAIAQYHRQLADNGGWVAYLTGTDYFDTSKQVFVGAPNQNADGIFDFTSNAAVIQTIDWINNNPGAIYSEFSIRNVPDGEYILRISASAICPVYSDFFAARNYQKTSGTTRNVAGSNTTEYRVTVSGGNVTLSDTIIEDLTDPFGNDFTSFQIYVSGNDNAGTTINDLWTDARIHKSRVVLGDSGSDLIAGYTDHNGFIFNSLPNFSTATDLTVKTIRSGQYTFNAAAATAYNVYTGAAWGTGIQDGTGEIGIYKTADNNITDYSRSIVKGNFVGQQRGGITVTPTFATPSVPSDSNGDFSFILYADTEYYITNGLTGNGVNNVSLYFASNDINLILAFLPTNSSANLNLDINNFGTNNPLILTSLFSNTILSSQFSKPNFKGGYSSQIGIVYYDEGDRRCSVSIVPESNFSVPFYPVLGTMFNADIKVSIYNTPPNWAVKYQIVRIRNTQHTKFLQWAANSVQYVDALFNAVSQTSAKFLKINLDNIGYYTTNLHPNSALTYSFSKGDRIRLIANSAGVIFNQIYDYEIVRQDGNDIYIENNFDINLELPTKYGLFFEIYTPALNQQTNLFFEVGECYPVQTAVFNGIKRKYHVGKSQNQSFGGTPLFTVTPAVVTFSEGGTYKRIRQIPVNVSGTPILINQLVDDESVSDFYESEADGTGRENVYDPSIQQKELPTSIRFSNVYLSETTINGLYSFEGNNEKVLSTVYGLIQKLILVNENVLKAICDNSFQVSMYINRAVLKTAIGQNIVAFADDIIGTPNKLQRMYGTQHPESVVINDEGDVFGWDERVGVVWRSSGNGLIPISEYKMTPEFTRIANERNALNPSYSGCPAIFDLYKKQYKITFQDKDIYTGSIDSFIVDLPSFDNSLINKDAFYHLEIKPLGTVLFNATIPSTTIGFPNVASIIASGINKIQNGYVASINNLGQLVITPPSNTPSHISLVIEITYTDNAPNHTVPKHYNNVQQLQVITYPATGRNRFNNDTIVFSMRKDRWTENYDYYNPDGYARLRTDHFIFKGGKMYFISESAVPNTCYGNDIPFLLTYVVNPELGKQKIFQQMCVNINDKEISCPNIDVPPSERVPAGMNTELKKAHFKMVHGKYWSNITRDKNTPNMTTDKAWVNGRPMTGQMLKTQLKNDSKKKFKLIDITTIYINSELS